MYHLRTLEESNHHERQYLAPYACRAEDSLRAHYDEIDEDDPRTAYQHDIDRIQHSIAFRRLQFKTQVYAFHEGDFYRTRLTHSIEVAEVGRGLARLLRANEDLVEAIALAHDVGHPPFGHAGERKLKELMRAAGDDFEHNLHALRTLDVLETRYAEWPGLNLTWDVREGIARHETPYDEPEFLPEFASPQPSLEAQIAGLADVIAYCTHDAEDALRIRVLTVDDLREIPLWREAMQQKSQVAGYVRHQPDRQYDIQVRGTVRYLIGQLVTGAARHTMANLERLNPRSAADVRNAPHKMVALPPDLHDQMNDLRLFLHERVYRDPRVLRMQRKGAVVLERLWEAFTNPHGNENGKSLLPRRTQTRMEQEGIPLHRAVCDYIAGMTDRHAMDLHNVLNEAYVPSLTTFS